MTRTIRGASTRIFPELLYRERKVAKLIDAMDAVLRHRVTADEAARLSLEIMTVVVTHADVRPPSAATMDAVADRLIARDRAWEGCECRYRGDAEDASCCPLHHAGDANRDEPGARD